MDLSHLPQSNFMKYLLILFFLSNSIVAWSCQCFSLKTVKELAKNAEYIIVGNPVENLHHNDSIKRKWDSENFGMEVKLKVVKVIKGDVKSEFVYINQFEVDNCRTPLKFGEQYIIIGTRILSFENQRPFSEKEYSIDKIFETIQPPPPPPIGGKTIEKFDVFNVEMELVNHWNKIAENEIILFTYDCGVFNSKSPYGKYFLRKY